MVEVIRRWFKHSKENKSHRYWIECWIVFIEWINDSISFQWLKHSVTTISAIITFPAIKLRSHQFNFLPSFFTSIQRHCDSKTRKNRAQGIVHVHASNKSSRACNIMVWRFMFYYNRFTCATFGGWCRTHTLQLRPGDRKANQLIYQELDPKVDDCMHIFSSW